MDERVRKRWIGRNLANQFLCEGLGSTTASSLLLLLVWWDTKILWEIPTHKYLRHCTLPYAAPTSQVKQVQALTDRTRAEPIGLQSEAGVRKRWDFFEEK